jgi:valyl-tRNA synthetase
MILMTTYATGQIPFETVYLHGLVRTRDGKKMSKSDPSTCIDPLEVISNYGADALRLSMIVGQSPGNDFRLYEEKIAGYRNFINKLWNASRFVLMQCEEAGLDPMKLANDNWQEEEKEDLGLADRALLSSLQCLVDDVTKGLEEYRLSETGERLYSFTWNFFCDWYLELSKGDSSPTVLVHTLRTIVQLLHPYCPFVTEELWDSIKPANAGKLIRHPWPSSDASLKDAKAQEQLDVVIDVVTAIRKMRAEYKVEQGKKIDVFVHTKKHFNLLEDERSQIVHLGNLSRFILDTNPQQHSNSASMFLKDVEVHLPLEGLIDVKKEYVSLTEEKKNLEKYIRGIQAKLANKDFVKRAPEEVVEGEKRKMKDSEEKLRKIESRLEMLGD